MAKASTPQWDKLSRQAQDLYLTLLWKDGHSERAIADFLGTGKGTIVRRRQTGLRLSAADRGAVKSSVDPERFRDLLDLHGMEQMEARGVAVIAPVEKEAEEAPPHAKPQKLATSEASQCTHVYKEGHRCAFRWTDPATRTCDLHH